MNWPADKALCAGMNCARHSKCLRYTSAEGNTNERQVWIGRCADLSGFMAAKLSNLEPIQHRVGLVGLEERERA